MTVKELNREQLNGLKQMYYENDNEESQLYYDKYELIPDYVIFEYYDGLEFNDDDIWRVFE